MVSYRAGSLAGSWLFLWHDSGGKRELESELYIHPRNDVFADARRSISSSSSFSTLLGLYFSSFFLLPTTSTPWPEYLIASSSIFRDEDDGYDVLLYQRPWQRLDELRGRLRKRASLPFLLPFFSLSPLLLMGGDYNNRLKLYTLFNLSLVDSSE